MEKFNSSENLEKSSSLDFFRKFKKFLHPLIAASFLVGVVPSSSKPGVDEAGFKKTTSTMSESSETSLESDRDWEMPDVRITFIRDGIVDPLALLAPLQIEIPSTLREKLTKEFSVQNVYGELFLKDEPMSVTDYEEMAKKIDQVLTQVVGEELIGLDFNKEVYRDAEGKSDAEGSKITSIEISPSSSFEGPASKGPKTLKRGNIDPENIKLAQRRGLKAEELATQVLSEQGFDGFEVIQNEGVEVQLSDQEFEALVLASKEYSGKDDLEKIFKLIKDYNDDKVENPDVVKVLDQIVASKRHVQIKITFDKEGKRVILIPIPIFLLFALRLLKRKPKEYPLEGSKDQLEERASDDQPDELTRKRKNDYGKMNAQPWRKSRRGLKSSQIVPKARRVVGVQRMLGSSSPTGQGRGPHKSGAGKRSDRMV